MKKRSIWLISFVGMIIVEAVILLSIFMISCFTQNWISALSSDVSNDVYFTILSLAFIVSSLSSMLSERNMPIYWSDVQYEMLVRPKVTNLTSLIAYVCATVIVSSVVWLVDERYLLYCLIITIAFLLLLTWKSITSHFSREHIKRDLRNEYLEHKNSKLCEKLLTSTETAIDNSDVQIFCENMELFKDGHDYFEFGYLLRYTSNVNPFLLCKLPADDVDVKLLFNTISRIISTESNDASLPNLLELLISKKIESVFFTYVDGIGSIETMGDYVEYWQFQKAQNQVSSYFEKYNQSIVDAKDNIIDLIAISLISEAYDNAICIISTTERYRNHCIDSASLEINRRYGSSNCLKSILPYFCQKMKAIDVYGANEKSIKEVRILLLNAIRDHRVSNNQLSKIVNGLSQLKDSELMEVIEDSCYDL